MFIQYVSLLLSPSPCQFAVRTNIFFNGYVCMCERDVVRGGSILWRDKTRYSTFFSYRFQTMFINSEFRFFPVSRESMHAAWQMYECKILDASLHALLDIDLFCREDQIRMEDSRKIVRQWAWPYLPRLTNISGWYTIASVDFIGFHCQAELGWKYSQ